MIYTVQCVHNASHNHQYLYAFSHHSTISHNKSQNLIRDWPKYVDKSTDNPGAIFRYDVILLIFFSLYHCLTYLVASDLTQLDWG